MSDRYEVVLSCFLRDDTPASVMTALRRHLGMDAACPEDLDDDGQLDPLLAPDDSNDSRLPGGDVASLRRTVQEFTSSGERCEWELFARNDWVDDSMLYLRGLLDLIAPHVARPGHGGRVRDIDGTAVTVFTFRDGTYEPTGIPWGIDRP
ncbi:hypothetical protein ABZ557_00545 [Streptomyces sp. NPDC019645]|uniref:hypothetical protein n=1 Tax=Streptomyces sp. NPDC019645 TaxID=3154786 RepID=UPI00340ABF0A